VILAGGERVVGEVRSDDDVGNVIAVDVGRSGNDAAPRIRLHYSVEVSSTAPSAPEIR
jgi:hypothetical protein